MAPKRPNAPRRGVKETARMDAIPHDEKAKQTKEAAGQQQKADREARWAKRQAERDRKVISKKRETEQPSPTRTARQPPSQRTTRGSRRLASTPLPRGRGNRRPSTVETVIPETPSTRRHPLAPPEQHSTSNGASNAAVIASSPIVASIEDDNSEDALDEVSESHAATSLRASPASPSEQLISLPPEFENSSELLEPINDPFNHGAGIKCVRCDIDYRVAYDGKDYLEYSHVPVYSPIHSRDDHQAKQRKDQAKFQRYDYHARRQRIDGAAKVLAANDEAWRRFLAQPAEVDEDEREIDRRRGSWQAKGYRIRDANWAQVIRWRKKRERRRRQIMRKWNLHDGETHEFEDGHLIARGGQGRVYITRGVWKQRNVKNRGDKATRLIVIKIGYRCEVQDEKELLLFIKPHMHPHIVSIIIDDDYEIEDKIWGLIVTPHANCGALSTWIKHYHDRSPGKANQPGGTTKPGWSEEGVAYTIPEELLWTIMQQLLQGLRFLHSGVMHDGRIVSKQWTPIAHLDLKPGNVLVDWNQAMITAPLAEQYKFRISDFGHATFQKKRQQIFGFHGTRMYTSPESGRSTNASSASGYSTSDIVQDIWSLGATLHVAATWQSPRWTKVDVLRKTVAVNGVLQERTDLDQILYKPINIWPVHLAPDHKRRIPDDRESEYVGRREARQYSQLFSYHLLHLCSYVDAADPELRRPTVGEALDGVLDSLKQINAVDTEHYTANIDLSLFDWQARECRSKSRFLDKLGEFHYNRTKEQFQRARDVAFAEGLQEAATEYQQILTTYLGPAYDPVAPSPEGGMAPIGTAQMRQQPAGDHQHTSGMSHDKDMLPSETFFPGPHSPGVLR